MIDLSHRIASGMNVFPGDPEVRLSRALMLEQDGVQVTDVHFGSHTGTHLDAPSHTIAGGRTLDDIELGELVGEALVFHLAGRELVADRREIDEGMLGLDRFTEVPPIVMIHTGWDEYFGSERYFRHPFLAAGVAKSLVQLGMHVLAVDTLNPDLTPGDGEDADFAVHEIVLGNDGLIVENLRGLDQLEERAHIGFFPIRLAASDGAPVRAAAFDSPV